MSRHPLGATRPRRAPLRLFLFASALLHLLLALLLPVGGLVRLVGPLASDRRTASSSGELPSREGFSIPEAAPFLPLGALRLQVLEIEIESDALALEPAPVPDLPAEAAELEPPIPIEEVLSRLDPARERRPAENEPAAGAGVAASAAGSSGSPGEHPPGEGEEGGGRGDAGGEGGQIVPPVIVAMSWPEYPRGARTRVPVVLAVHVTETGEVDAVRLENDSGCPACEKAAVASAWRLRCLPGTRDGKPIAMWMRFPVTFGRR